MKFLLLVIATVLIASFDAKPSHAQGWRCADSCPIEEALFNDIEDITASNWVRDVQSQTVTLPMPGFPMSCWTSVCEDDGWGDVRCQNVYEDFEVPWAVTLSGSHLRAFAIGRTSVVASPDGISASGADWATSLIHTNGAAGTDLAFAPSASDVMLPQGPTGVRDLGTATPLEGGFLSNNLSVWGYHDVLWDCTIGYPGHQIHDSFHSDPNEHRDRWIDYPISWTPAADILAEFIRNQFRTAVRTAVNR
jgi:hypothetical protein